MDKKILTDLMVLMHPDLLERVAEKLQLPGNDPRNEIQTLNGLNPAVIEAFFSAYYGHNIRVASGTFRFPDKPEDATQPKNKSKRKIPGCLVILFWTIVVTVVILFIFYLFGLLLVSIPTGEMLRAF